MADSALPAEQAPVQAVPAAPAGPNAALAEAWRKYRGWAARARATRGELDRWRKLVLCLTVAGAVLATLASQLPSWLGSADPGGRAAWTLSVLSAVAMALAAYSSRSILDPAAERRWLRARALGESCKSESYRFATAVPPYDGDDAGPKLLDKLQQLLASGADVPAIEISDEDAAKGMPAYPLPIEGYIDQRVRDQIEDYYHPRSTENERKATFCAQSIQALSAAAAVLAAISALATGSLVAAWVAPVGAIAAAIGAYAQGQRFQRLAATYGVTADRLSLRLALWKVTTQLQPGSAADQALVIDAETIMAAENEAWLAEFLRDPTAAAQSNGGEAQEITTNGGQGQDK